MNRQQRIRQRAQRKTAEQRHFTEPLTGRRARRISKAQANMAYGETDRQIKGQLRASAQRESQMSDWYNTFAQEIAASRGDVANAYGSANQAIAGNIGTAAADDAARRSQLTAQNAQLAQLTGGPVDAAAASRGVEAQNQRQLFGAALAAPVAAQGANAFAYLTNQRNTARGEGLHQRVQERKRRQSLQQDRKALLKEKGQYRVSKLNELRAGERDYQIQKAAFPLKRSELAADAAQSAADQRLEEAKFSETQRHNRATERNSREDGQGGLTPSQRRAQKEERQSATAAAWRTIKANGVPKTAKEWAGMEVIVAEEEGVSAAQAREAVRRVKAKVRQRQQQSQSAERYPAQGPGHYGR